MSVSFMCIPSPVYSECNYSYDDRDAVADYTDCVHDDYIYHSVNNQRNNN